MHPNSFYATTLSLVSLKKEPFKNSATKIGDFLSPHEGDARISTLRKKCFKLAKLLDKMLLMPIQ
jgi:hypothetical protein